MLNTLSQFVICPLAFCNSPCSCSYHAGTWSQLQLTQGTFPFDIVNVNVNKQYISTCKSCNKGYDDCAMRVVFSKLQNCPGFNDGDFRDGGSAFQHMPTYSNIDALLSKLW